MRRRRPRLGLARYRYGNFSVVDPHREVRHQRTLDIPHYLLGRQLRGRQHVDLLHRPGIALDDLRGYHAWKRENEIFSALDWKNASGDVAQFSLGMCGILMLNDELAANIVDDWCLIKQNPRVQTSTSARRITRVATDFYYRFRHKKTAPA